MTTRANDEEMNCGGARGAGGVGGVGDAYQLVLFLIPIVKRRPCENEETTAVAVTCPWEMKRHMCRRQP